MAATKKAPAKKAAPKKAAPAKKTAAKKAPVKKVAAKKSTPTPVTPTANESRTPVSNFKYGMGDLRALEQAIADGKDVTLRIDSGPNEVVITGL